jgi:hypothetical protein
LYPDGDTPTIPAVFEAQVVDAERWTADEQEQSRAARGNYTESSAGDAHESDDDVTSPSEPESKAGAPAESKADGSVLAGGSQQQTAIPIDHTGYVEVGARTLTRDQIEKMLKRQRDKAQSTDDPVVAAAITAGNTPLNGSSIFPLIFPELFPGMLSPLPNSLRAYR